MLSRDLEVTLSTAFNNARDKRHEYMTVEHLLLALLENDIAAEVLLNCGADLNRLRTGLTDYIDATTPVVPELEADRETQPTLGFQRVLQRAVFHVQSSGRQEVTGANVLVAIFSEQESQSVYLLSQQDIARLDIVNYISHGISRQSGQEQRPEPGPQENREEEGSSSANALEAYATNLNEMARQGKIDPLIGREQEVLRVIQVLCRRRKNNPLLVG